MRIASFFIIVSLTFLLMKALPGDPFSQEQGLPPNIRQALREHYGLDDPWYKQYGRYLKSVVTLDFGPSFVYHDRSVTSIIKEGFPVSLLLGLEALFLATVGGVTLGVLAAVSANKWQDRMVMVIAVFGVSLPSFLLAALLQYVGGRLLGIFPVASWGTFSHTVLPACALALLPLAFLARLTRANMIDVLQAPHMKTALAKGLSQWEVIRRHGLKNALLPLIPFMGQCTVNILVGSFIVEKIFSIPGLGRWFVISVMNRDYTVIMGVTVFYSFLLLTTVALCDLLHRKLDPRI